MQHFESKNPFVFQLQMFTAGFIYTSIYVYMFLEKKTTNKLQLHPYKPVL